MKKENNLVRIISFIGFFVVVIFLFALVFLNQIKSGIFVFISQWGYPAIFLITLIVDTLAQPIGPEVALLSGNVLELDMFSVALVTMAGSIVASFINYRVGKFFYSRVSHEQKYVRYMNMYQKHGRYGLLVAALGPVPYVPFCWFSGAFGLPLYEFLLWGIFPRMARIAFISYMIVRFIP